MMERRRYMGDGRYYTYFQFFDIVLLTILTTVSVVSVLSFYYKKNKGLNILYIFIPSIIILLFLIGRVVETVIPNLVWALELRKVQGVLLLVALILCILSKEVIERHYKAICFLIPLMGFLAIHSTIFLKTYDFHNIIYTGTYKILVFLLLVVSSAYLLLEKKAYIYKGICILLPLGIYVYMLMLNHSGICYMELVLSQSVIVYLNIIFSLNSERSNALLAFDKIGNISTNYIFVVDHWSKVIYSNHVAKQSEFFGEVTKIKNISEIFQCDFVQTYSQRGQACIKIKKKEQEFYFSYTIKKLHHLEKDIGKIITITNITELVLLLNALEAKKRESKKLNDELKNYSKVVYHLEKEKTINKLLEEVIINRDEQMSYLTNLIKDTKAKMDDKTFEHYIEISIDKSNELLEAVRDTVTHYREYYGG